MSAKASSARTDGKIGVLFVCLGNICRSPSAEAVFKAVVERQGLQDAFFIDSCGTGGGSPDWYQEGGFSYHEGDPSDERMTAAAVKRGVRLTSRSRPLQPVDLAQFDFIIGMENKNVRAIQTAADYWAGRPSGRGVVPHEYKSKCSLMTDFLLPGSKFAGSKLVPDPYYSGQSAFEGVLDLLEDCCEGLLQHIAKERQLVTTNNVTQ